MQYDMVDRHFLCLLKLINLAILSEDVFKK